MKAATSNFLQLYSLETAFLLIILWIASLTWLYYQAQKKLKIGLFYLFMGIIFSITSGWMHLRVLSLVVRTSWIGIFLGCVLPALIFLMPHIFLLWEIRRISSASRIFKHRIRFIDDKNDRLGMFWEYYFIDGSDRDEDDFIDDT